MSRTASIMVFWRTKAEALGVEVILEGQSVPDSSYMEIKTNIDDHDTEPGHIAIDITVSALLVYIKDNNIYGFDTLIEKAVAAYPVAIAVYDYEQEPALLVGELNLVSKVRAKKLGRIDNSSRNYATITAQYEQKESR